MQQRAETELQLQLPCLAFLRLSMSSEGVCEGVYMWLLVL